jgi:DNA gyrase subunit A
MKVIGTQESLDKAIAIIRHSANPQEAKEGLIAEFELSEIQAQAILDLDWLVLQVWSLIKLEPNMKKLWL